MLSPGGVESLVRACRRCHPALRVSEFASCQNDWDRRKFPWLDYLLQEVTCSVERRISLFWIVRGRTRMSTSLQSLHGVVSGNPPSLIIGFDAWRLNSIALRNSSLGGLSTGRARGEALRLRMNFLTMLSPGLDIQIQG